MKNNPLLEQSLDFAAQIIKLQNFMRNYIKNLLVKDVMHFAVVKEKQYAIYTTKENG